MWSPHETSLPLLTFKLIYHLSTHFFNQAKLCCNSAVSLLLSFCLNIFTNFCIWQHWIYHKNFIVVHAQWLMRNLAYNNNEKAEHYVFWLIFNLLERQQSILSYALFIPNNLSLLDNCLLGILSKSFLCVIVMWQFVSLNSLLLGLYILCGLKTERKHFNAGHTIYIFVCFYNVNTTFISTNLHYVRIA